MQRFYVSAAALFFAAAFFFAGCAPAAVTSASPLPGDEPQCASPSPEASAVPVSPADAETAARDAFAGAFTLNYDEYDTSKDIVTIPELIENLSMFTGMAADYLSAVRAAADKAFLAVADVVGMPAFELDLPDADWRLMVALCCECAEKPEEKLLRLSDVSVFYENGKLTLGVSLPDFEEFFGNETSDVQYAALSIYAYLNAAYDEYGDFLDNDGTYDFPEGYIGGLVEPLVKRTLRESWYNDRSKATRRHMGTDIRAPLKTDIHSMTAGTVVNKGFGDLAGNYVTVLDDYGFYYTYCHMIELSTHVEIGDQVQAGDVIGNVGDTGNSDAPHLHVSIITPEHKYIDPYPLLVEIRALSKS